MRKLIRTILYFILANAFCFKIFSQEYTYKNFQTRDGLPSAEVYHALQDSKGYIWFATDNGVSKFDGYKFVNFDINNGLINNTVFDLYEDHKGRIWFIALSGRLCYYENGVIKHFEHNNLIDKNTKGRTIPVKQSFYIDSLDNVYLPLTHQGILKISKEGKITNLIDNQEHNTLLIKSLISDKYLMSCQDINNDKARLLINGNNLVFDLDISLHKSSLFFANNGQAKDEIFFSIDKRIYKYSNNKTTQIAAYPSDIIWFSKDKKNNYWLSVRHNGVKCYTSFQSGHSSFSWFLKNKDVSSVLIDNENGYWFTTLNNGVFYLPSLEIKTIEIPAKISNNVLSIEASSESIFLGLDEQQILCYDKSLSKIKQKFSFNKDGTPSKLVYHNELGSLISGTYAQCYLINENSITEKVKKQAPPDVAIKSLAVGKGKYFWAGTYTGLYKISMNEVVYNSKTDDDWQQAVFAILENNDKSLWLGTFEGLWEYKNGEYINHGIKNKVLSHRVNALYKNNNNLFIGTKGKGLIILDLNDYSTKVISATDGLSSNSISSIAEYKNEIWLGTNKGVNRLVFENNKLESISRIDYGLGLKGDEINQVLVDNNMLYIASREGFNYIDLDKLKWTKEKPQLHIQNLKINYKDTVPLSNYQLTSHQNNIEISYAGISYKSNKNILYKYQLLPFDKKWKVTHSTSINYSGLLPGDYEFRIMAMNESGTWSDVNNSIKFSIDYPFYKKWWFYLLVALFVIFILLLSLQNILQKIRKENRLRMELKRYAQKSIAAQLNPHFIFNSLNSLNYLILKNDKLESSKYLSKLSTYLRATFDALQKEELTLNDEIKIVSQYLKLEKIRLKEKLNYEIVLDNYVDSDDYKIPGLFILPLLENAIWKRIQAKKDHGFIKITIEKYEKYILVLIEDNGITGSFEGTDNKDSNIEQRKQLLNDFYKGQIVFDFIPDTLVSFNEMGNILELKLLI